MLYLFSPDLQLSPSAAIGQGPSRIYHSGAGRGLDPPQGHFSTSGAGTPIWKTPTWGTHQQPSSARAAGLCPSTHIKGEAAVSAGVLGPCPPHSDTAAVACLISVSTAKHNLPGVSGFFFQPVQNMSLF